jgi:hypothetical protein
MAQSARKRPTRNWHSPFEASTGRSAEETMMVRTISRVSCAALCAAGWLMASPAQAADKPTKDADSASPTDEKAAETTEGSDTAEGEKAESPAKAGAPAEPDANADTASDNSPAELPGKTYRFVGLRYRGIVVPKFMVNLFADGGRTVYVNAIGPEFAIRKDGFEYNLSAWLAFYHMGDTGFKGSSDPKEAWEIISSKLNILYLTADFLWSHEFSPEFSLNYGVGAGFGIVFGDLFRTQSFPTGGPTQNPNDYTKCSQQNDPRDPQAGSGTPYCGTDNNHYPGYTEKGWANGGQQPLLFPWLMLQTGLRFKPAKSFAGRLDLGFGTSGFFFGLGGDYGL